MSFFAKSWGVHPDPAKDPTAGLAARRAPVPSALVIPLHQHTGVPCKPLVKPRQEVLRGEMIGDVEALITAPVHASVAGVIKRIDVRPHPSGTYGSSVILEPVSDPDLDLGAPKRSLDEALALPPEEICKEVRAAGIVGMGGAGFPAHVKLSPPPGKQVEIAILNGAECEPFLTADHRTMLERAADIIDGFRLIMRALGATTAFIGIEDNKPDAIEVMKKMAKERDAGNTITVRSLHTRYPQGAEKTLIHALTGREVPSGGLPADVGVLVSNVGTAAAIRDALVFGQPLIERVVTVSGGAVTKPANLLALVGTPIRDLLEECGWQADRTARVILGGPMMGVTTSNIDVPVTKTTSGVLALTADEVAKPTSYPCIHCERCARSCPMNLQPSKLAALCEYGHPEEAKDLGLLDCFECGSCAYGCPARIPIVHWIRVGKAMLRRVRAA